MEHHEYRYYKDDKQRIFRMHVEPDEFPWNPRTDMDGNIGTMFCMHPRYGLGDRTKYQDMDGLKRAVIQELGISMKRIRSYVKTGKANIELTYNHKERQWEIWGAYSFLGKREYGLFCANPDVEFLEDDLIAGITLNDLQKISNDNLVILPLYLYDHSGLSMSCADFGDPWDSGQVGIIWTTIDRVKAARLGKQTKKEWIRLAEQDMRAEVKMYNMYLQGEAYGYIEERKSEDGQWEECDSCWGFYTDTFDPLCELADEIWGPGTYTEELPEVA